MNKTVALVQPEVCVNLWAYVDEGTTFVNRVTGRGYILSGTDADKLATLHLLAQSDFLSSAWFQVPDNFSVTCELGTLTRVIEPDALQDDQILAMVFDEVYNNINETMASQIRFQHEQYTEFKMELPENPLYVLTYVVEYLDGRIEPTIN